MSLFPIRAALATTLGLGLLAAGCATAPSAPARLAPGSQATIQGTVAAVDLQPWTYDGNAQVQVQTDDYGSVHVQLPARWNLCKAAPVDVESLKVGRRVRAVGTVGEEGQMVVCEQAAHQLTTID